MTTTATPVAPVPTRHAPPESAKSATQEIVTTRAARISLAVLRLATGFIFLWAFLDKAFGLGFATPTERAWINGGTPSQGFLNSPAVTGPLKPFFAAISSPTTDVLFMLGMIAIGVAVMLGIGLRISAVTGTVIMLFMYLAEWPFSAHTASNNPLVDYHLIYALALIVVAATAAGSTWGLGARWNRLSIVKNHRWLA